MSETMSDYIAGMSAKITELERERDEAQKELARIDEDDRYGCGCRFNVERTVPTLICAYHSLIKRERDEAVETVEDYDVQISSLALHVGQLQAEIERLKTAHKKQYWPTTFEELLRLADENEQLRKALECVSNVINDRSQERCDECGGDHFLCNKYGCWIRGSRALAKIKAEIEVKE